MAKSSCKRNCSCGRRPRPGPILRRFFLDDVVGRYYDPRQVVIDLIADIFKEQKPPLIRPMIAMAEPFLAEMGMEPVTLAEVQS